MNCGGTLNAVRTKIPDDRIGTKILRATWYFVMALALFIPAGSNLKAAENAPNVAIIYDLSNSMWAKLNNTAKLTLAQNALGASLPSFEKKINLALLSFGHRNKAGCDDTEVIAPLKLLRSKNLITAVKKLRPRGNAPIGKALLDAANLVEDRSDPYTIILISDGASNCPINPCDTAVSLKGAFKSFRIEVVGIGKQNQKSIQPLQCLAASTDGQLAYADNAKSLKGAIAAALSRAVAFQKAEVLAKTTPPTKSDKEAWEGATEVEVAPVAKNSEKETADKFKTELPATDKSHGGLALVAQLVEKASPIKKGIIWRIYSAKPDKATGKHTLISAHRSAQPVMSLKAGSYLINAAYGRAYLTRKVDITPGKNQTEEFVLNAGGLRISNVLANGAAVPENSVIYDIYSDERDQFGKRLKVIGNIRPGLVIRLNAGIYHIVSTYGDANARSQADVSIEAGKLTAATINHIAAKVTLKLVYQRGGEALADTKWSVLTPAGEIIKKSAGALPSHFLAVGSYTILAERGAEKYRQKISLNAGENRQIEVIIQ